MAPSEAAAACNCVWAQSAAGPKLQRGAVVRLHHHSQNGPKVMITSRRDLNHGATFLPAATRSPVHSWKASALVRRRREKWTGNNNVDASLGLRCSQVRTTVGLWSSWKSKWAAGGKLNASRGIVGANGPSWCACLPLPLATSRRLWPLVQLAERTGRQIDPRRRKRARPLGRERAGPAGRSPKWCIRRAEELQRSQCSAVHWHCATAGQSVQSAQLGPAAERD